MINLVAFKSKVKEKVLLNYSGITNLSIECRVNTTKDVEIEQI